MLRASFCPVISDPTQPKPKKTPMTKEKLELESLLISRKENSSIIIKPETPEAIKTGLKIFVVGPPRSGTTILYKALAKEFFLPECTLVSNVMRLFDETYRYCDDARFNYYAHNFTNLAEIFKKPVYDLLYTASYAVGGQEEKTYIYKDPVLMRYLEYFSLFFGETYKTVVCLRDPRDVVASMVEVYRKQSPEESKEKLLEIGVNLIFPYFQKIHDIDHEKILIDKDRVFFLRYEDFVVEDENIIQGLSHFLDLELNTQVKSEYLTESLEKDDPFYSKHYDKELTDSLIGKYKTIFNDREIAKLERIFAYYFDRLGYNYS